MTLPLPPGQKPREWQLRYLRAVIAAYLRGLRRLLCDACTGSGKGSVIAGMAARSAEKGRRVLVVIGRKVLVHDIAARIRALERGIDVGVVQAEHNEPDCTVVVACVGSLRKPRLAAIGRIDVLIEDEAHHVGAPSYQRIRKELLKRNPGLLILGFTATPYTSRPDGRIVPLDQHYDATVYSYGLVDAIADGAVVPPRGIRVDTGVDLSGCALTAAGEFDPEELSRLVDTPERNALVAEQHMKHSQGRPGLVFCVDIAHAEHVAEAMREAGIRAKAVHSKLPKRTIEAIFAEAASGAVDVLCSADMILEGFDWPAAYIGHRLRPTMSTNVIVQMMGRLVRKCEGKDHCFWVEYVDRGLPLELPDTAAMLCDEATRRRNAPPRAWEEGDCVVHRFQTALGAGLVLKADEHTVTVDWGDKHGVKEHAHGELREAPIDAPDIPLPALDVHWLGDRALHILPRQAPQSALGWVRHQGSWSCAGKSRAGATVAALVEQDSRGDFKLWLTTSTRTVNADGKRVTVTTAKKKAKGRHLLPLQREAERWLRSRGARATLTAPWRAEPATDGQLRALARSGVPGVTSAMTKGEAGAILDHIGAQRAVRDRLRELRRRHAGGGR